MNPIQNKKTNSVTLSESIEQKVSDIIKSKNTGIIRSIKKNKGYTSYKKVISLINQELTKKITAIKKMDYEDAKIFEQHGITLIVELDKPLENETVQNDLKNYYNNEGCFFQYRESKDRNYVCMGTKLNPQ